jgi:hypothetical protein
MSDMEVLVAAIPPTLAALFAALGLRAQQRNRRNRRSAELAEARDRISAIQAWLETFEALTGKSEAAPERIRALADLQVAYDLIARTEEETRNERATSTLQVAAEAVLLLDVRSRSRTATILQIVYYVSLVWTTIWLAAALMFGVVIAVSDPEETLSQRVGFSLGISVLCLAIGIAPAFLLNLVYRAANGRHVTPSRSGQGEPSRP